MQDIDSYFELQSSFSSDFVNCFVALVQTFLRLQYINPDKALFLSMYLLIQVVFHSSAFKSNAFSGSNASFSCLLSVTLKLFWING